MILNRGIPITIVAIVLLARTEVINVSAELKKFVKNSASTVQIVFTAVEITYLYNGIIEHWRSKRPGCGGESRTPGKASQKPHVTVTPPRADNHTKAYSLIEAFQP